MEYINPTEYNKIISNMIDYYIQEDNSFGYILNKNRKYYDDSELELYYLHDQNELKLDEELNKNDKNNWLCRLHIKYINTNKLPSKKYNCIKNYMCENNDCIQLYKSHYKKNWRKHYKKDVGKYIN